MRTARVLVIGLTLAVAILLAGAQNQPQAGQDSPQRPPATSGEQSVSNDQAATTMAATVVLPEATPIKLKLLHSLNTKTVVVDDPLNFSVAEDVMIGGTPVIKSGAVAIGRVRQVKPARTFGRGGQLSMEMQYLKVGRIRVPLRGSQARAGASKTGETVALVALFGVSGLVKHGSEIEVKEGSLFTAYVDQATQLPQQVDPVSQPNH